MSWFHIRPVADGVWLVAEPGHVNCWLVAGTERAVLLDTGLGLAPIRAVVEALTPVPVEAVNSHYHFDHTGGNAEFERVAIHELGAPLLAAGVPAEVRSGYLAYARRLLAAAETYRDLDHDYFHLLSADSDPRPLPDDLVPELWDPPPGPVPELLREGDVIDLGGRTLTVLHTPGHSPDSVCFVDDRAGLLFGGDTLNTGPIYAQMPDSDVTAFARSTARLAELYRDISLVLMCHFGRGIVEAQFVREVAESFDRLVNGDVTLRPARDCLLDEAREAVFPQCSILVPPAEG
jgi:glyoxylase-like metal-dependent hydrolase (beta-lactamase superfamily II)